MFRNDSDGISKVETMTIWRAILAPEITMGSDKAVTLPSQ